MSFFGRRTPSDAVPDDPSHTSGDTPADDQEDTGQLTPPQPAHRFDTVLGAGSVLDGKLSSDGNVRMDGAFTGELDISENVLVGQTAVITANIDATNVSVAGTVHGDISGGKVHLLSTAKVWGNITARSLITEDGAFIDGKISMIQPDPPPSDDPEEDLSE